MDLIQKIKNVYPSLTKGLKQVADNYMIDPIIFATHPAKKVGEKIGVSETMIIRFCNELGYKGFKDFQKEVQLSLLNVNIDQSSYEISDDRSTELLNSMKMDLVHIQKNMELIDEHLVKQIIEAIINADRRMIVGYYHSFTFAHWLYINLRHYIDNTMLYRAEDDIDLIEDLPENSLLIIFSFFRYSRSSIDIAKQAKERNIKVISITDSPFSPITDYSDIFIDLSFTKNRGTIHKAPITMSFINLLLFEILKEKKINTELSYNSRKYYVNHRDKKI